jgi:hypothetical protein
MPRKSAEAIAAEHWRRTNDPPPPPPPDPPAWLSKTAARHWREIVKDRPADYWVPPMGEFLAHLCCHLTTSDFIWRELNGLDLADPKAFRRYRALSVMAGRESRMISLLMTKLRLLPRPPGPVQNEQHQARRLPWGGIA